MTPLMQEMGVYMIREHAAQVALQWGKSNQVDAGVLTRLVNDLRNMDIERLLR